MKRSLGFLSVLFVLLVGMNTNIWAQEFDYFSYATAKISGEQTDRGIVGIVPSVQFATLSKVVDMQGNVVEEAPVQYYGEGDLRIPENQDDLLPFLALPKDGESSVTSIVETGEFLTQLAMPLKPVYAGLIAQPYPGYYLKGWSVADGGFELGNAMPYLYTEGSNASSFLNVSPVRTVKIVMDLSALGMGIVKEPMPGELYLTEGSSNRYLKVVKKCADAFNCECRDWGTEVLTCEKDGNGQYVYFDVDGVNIYIPFRDEEKQRFYVLDDDGTRVDMIDGAYLPFPKDEDVIYMILKDPDSGTFMTHRFDLGAFVSSMMDGDEASAFGVLYNYVQGGERLMLSLPVLTEEKEGKDEMVYVKDLPSYMDGCDYYESDWNPINFLPRKIEIPHMQPIYATFAPVEVNGCTGGNIVDWAKVTDNSFDVTFSTSFASSTADFGEVEFLNQPVGGNFTATVSAFDAETGVVTIAVTFTPDAASLAPGEYKAELRLKSAGGESSVTCLLNVRVGAEANSVAAIGENLYPTLDAAIAAVQAGETITLRNNVIENLTQIGNYTINLDGWMLTGDVTVNGALTLKNGTVDGALTVGAAGSLSLDNVTTNSLTNNGTANLKRGVINGNLTNAGALTLEKGLEVLGTLTNNATATIRGARLANAINNKSTLNFDAAYFKSDNIGISKDGLVRVNVAVGSAFESGYVVLYAKNAAASIAADAPVCKIRTTGYAKLEDALLYAQNNPSDQVTITLLNDYTLPAGYYTLPANAFLLIPYTDDQLNPMKGSPKKFGVNDSYQNPYPFRVLTLDSDVHLDVFGSLEVSCQQFIGGQAEEGNAIPTGPYAWIKTNEGAEITLENDAHLYAWGFITGKGEIDARKGSAVHEDFQVYDWPGGGNAIQYVRDAYMSEAGAFPVNQYAMQNIEIPTKFHPCSRMYASFGATAMGMQAAADAIQIVGVSRRQDGAPDDVAMFLMDADADQDNTWVRKWYDIENDKQVWDVNSSAHLGSVYMDIPVFKIASQMGFLPEEVTGFDSRTFVLPITSNMKLHLLSGYMDITQNTEFLPGSELEINKTSTFTILDELDKAYDGRAIFDADADWMDNYAQRGPYHQIRYSPSLDPTLDGTHDYCQPNVRDIKRNDSSKTPVGDAKLNIHGTLQVDGYLLTTPGGAEIISNNEDAGTVYYPNALEFMGESLGVAAPTAGLITQMEAYIPTLAENDPTTAKLLKSMIYEYHAGQTIKLKSADLRNTSGFDVASTSDDINPVLPGESYCFLGDRWTRMNQFDELFAYDNYNEWYIKPSEYVSIATQAKDADGYYGEARSSKEPLENPDHTYSDAAGEGRLFIMLNNKLDGGFQWWEVELKDNLYHGLKNDTYYDYVDGEWVEKTFSITFVNWDGSDIPNPTESSNTTTYELHYGDAVFYNGTNPAREETVDYTYTFTGWSPDIKGAIVKGDATYTATYEATLRKYTIVFLNENGTEIERHFLTRDEMPVCEALPTKTGYYLQWTPAIGAVTGDAEYRATFTPEKPTSFMITFKNYDGTELKSGMVNVGETPACAEPTKPATSEYSYAFAGWNPAIEPVSQEMTYTAKFNEVANTYAIRFFQEDGVTQIGATQNLAYGVAPAIPEYVKDATAEFTYTTTWTPQVAAVTKAQDYTAVITPTKNKYTVTCVGEGCVFTGAGSYEYGEEVTLTLAAQTNYENAQWSDGTQGNSRTVTVTGDVTLTATATLNPGEDAQLFTITFLNENGEFLYEMEKLLNTIPSYTYTKESTAQYDYQIAWSPAIQPVRRNMEYQAVVTPVLRKYTITCEGEHCIFTGAGTYDYGTEVKLTLAAAAGYENAKWSDGTTADKEFIVTGDATYTASATLIPEPLIAVLGEEVDLTTPTEVLSFTFEASAEQSAYITGSIDNLSFKNNEMVLYYKYHFNAEARKWYTFGVPFEVNGDLVNEGTMVRETNYRIVRYNGSKRAANGANGSAWEITGDTLVPGELYMIKFLTDVDVVTFTGIDDQESLDYSGKTMVGAYGYDSEADDNQHAGWNGIANPALYYAKLGVSVNMAQLYDPETDSYETITEGFTNEVQPAGRAMFVQVRADGAVAVTPSTPSALAAPRRSAAVDDVERYVVTISQNGEQTDKVVLRSSEDAADRYIIGEDLAKAGVSSIVAQMWVNRYGAKLCVNNAAPVAGETTYPLGIYAPKAGEYTISAEDSEMDVVLMQNGVPVAKLNLDAYTLNLSKGTTNEYSIVVRRAPEIVTSVEIVSEDANAVRAQKVVVGGKLYILTGERVYDAAGMMVK